MIKAGIVDPAKVVRAALQDAASIAGLLITTEAMIAETPERSAPAMPGGGMGGMGGWATIDAIASLGDHHLVQRGGRSSIASGAYARCKLTISDRSRTKPPKAQLLVGDENRREE